MGILEKQSTRLALLDQHLSLLAAAPQSIWLLPIGVGAVILHFYEPITEYGDLLFGLLKIILNSILGKLNGKNSVNGLII